jgi:hypothetical protein
MKKTKKIISGILAGLCLTLAACGGNSAKEVSVPELAKQMEEAAGFPDTMVKVEDPMLEKLYGLDPALFSEYYAVTSGGATSDELLILKAKEKETAQEVEKTLRTRLKDRADSFASYAPEEAKKAEDGILVVSGDTVIYCICPNGKAAAKVLE